MKRKSNWKQYEKSRKALNNLTVQIGAIGKHDDSNLNNADILRMSETGVPTRNIPARFSITRALRENVKFISQFVAKSIEQNSKKGKINVDNIGNSVGIMIQNLVKSSIMSVLEPPLNDKYREKKVEQGYSPLPYIKTRQTLNSISYGVKKK